MKPCRIAAGLVVALILGISSPVTAQLVVLPAPRILTTMPMGGQVGTTVPVTITGESLDDKTELVFSDPRITAVAQKNAEGKLETDKFLVTIAADTPPGIYEARVMTRLGISSSRAFSVGTLPEVVREKPNTTIATAMNIGSNCVCNAYTSVKSVDFYTFYSQKGARVAVECVATGIDSKLKPVLIIADANGRDLAVDRRGGFLEFTTPDVGIYTVKVHGLTFQGGPECFYRLVVQTLPENTPVIRHAATQPVNAISLPTSLADAPSITETEPNNRPANAQKITLPCDIAGAFFPAADVDTFEFDAKKGEEWWVEVVSERLGLPTNSFVTIQQVIKEGDQEKLVDVAELNDLASPVKLSSNGYSYDGAQYDVGTADAMGKFGIKEDGTYRLQVRDLFGGTRSDPRCTYRLIVRKAQPDFALAAWALHMTLRNGDRAALSKPIALKNGGTMIFDVVAIRKDGFDSEIEISMDDLPPGVSACGLKIPAGKSAGTLIISAAEGVATATGVARILGKATIDGTTETRNCRLASMAWPVRDATQEIPNPRLMADAAVSVTGEEAATLTISPTQKDVIVAPINTKLTVPLTLTWRGEFSGALKLKTVGPGFEKVAAIDVPLKSPTLDLVIDLADLKLPAGEHSVSVFGGVVAKYGYNVAAVAQTTEELRLANEELTALTAASQAATAAAQAAAADEKATSDEQAKQAAEKLKAAEAGKTAIEKRLKAVTDAAVPKEIVDIVVSEPIRILVKPAENS